MSEKTKLQLLIVTADQLYGKGLHEKAFQAYLKIADCEDPHVLFRIGNMYHYGQGTSLNFEKAIAYYKLAIAQHSKEAYCFLALMYYKGEGVEKDPTEASRLLEQARKKHLL